MTALYPVFDVISYVCLVAGGIFCIIGGIGLLRLPDFYTRTHGASITDTMGAGLMILGLCFQAVQLMFNENGWVPDAWLVLVKLLFIGLFILLTSPTSGHALVKAAHADGIKWEGEDDDAIS